MSKMQKAIVCHLHQSLLLLLLLPVTVQSQVPDTLLAARDNSLITRMSLHVNGGFYLGGDYDGGISGDALVASGAGTRLLWYPERAAFRVGRVGANNWENANIGYFSFAAGDDTRASADGSVALGKLCQAVQASSFAVGEQNTASGAASVAMGYHAHTNARQGSFVFADRSTVDTLRAGVNHSANWRVSGGFRIFTTNNLSTGVTLQSGASVSNWGQASAVISTSTGALLTTGGVWQNASDVNRKHLFESIQGEEILTKLRDLPIQRWSYRVEDDKVRHIGPTAQDFYASFGLGNDDRSIGTVDADGVVMVGVQALEARTRQQATQIENLEAENKALQSRLDTIEKRLNINKAELPLIIVLALGGVALAGWLFRRTRQKSAL